VLSATAGATTLFLFWLLVLLFGRDLGFERFHEAAFHIGWYRTGLHALVDLNGFAGGVGHHPAIGTFCDVPFQLGAKFGVNGFVEVIA
jgi:hypothetical protein